MGKDENGNAVKGTNVMLVESTGNMVHVENSKMVVLQGLEDFVVVDTNDVLLICKKEREQEIKEYMAEVKKNKGERFL
jgi:mannose-1-phosphate guanylyltransferase